MHIHTAAGERIPLMTVAEAAAYLRVTEKALRRRIERRGVPYRRLGRSIRFMQSELNNWMAIEAGRSTRQVA